MSTREIAELVSAILDLKPAEIAEDRALSSYSTWTSLKQVQLVAALESEFGVSPSIKEIKAMRTVADFRRLCGAEGAP